MPLPALSEENQAVSEERRRVLSGNTSGDVLVLQNITKAYGSFKNKLAVNQLCLAVKKGEVSEKPVTKYGNSRMLPVISPAF